jgi:hypothetical protein
MGIVRSLAERRGCRRPRASRARRGVDEPVRRRAREGARNGFPPNGIRSRYPSPLRTPDPGAPGGRQRGLPHSLQRTTGRGSRCGTAPRPATPAGPARQGAEPAPCWPQSSSGNRRPALVLWSAPAYGRCGHCRGACHSSAQLNVCGTRQPGGRGGRGLAKRAPCDGVSDEPRYVAPVYRSRRLPSVRVGETWAIGRCPPRYLPYTTHLHRSSSRSAGLRTPLGPRLRTCV